MPKECRTTDTRKIWVFEQNGRKVTLRNTQLQESTKVKVDGCEIKDSDLRCDYMHFTAHLEMYIELKGSDLDHAVKQILATKERLGDPLKANKRAYICCRKVPRAGTNTQEAKTRLAKKGITRTDVSSLQLQDSY